MTRMMFCPWYPLSFVVCFFRSGQAGGRCGWVREWAGECRVWIMNLKSPNQTLETNRRPRSPLGAGQEFERAFYDPAFLSGGGRSAFC